MLTVSRRRVLTSAAALVLAAAGGGGSPRVDRWQVGMVIFDAPDGTAPQAPPAGWDWAGAGPEGLSMLVKGDSAYPTPHLAMARVLAPSETGRTPWQVVGNPPQPVIGTSDYVVVDVHSTNDDRSGTLVCATRSARTAVVLISGPTGWSPALRRAVLSGLEITDAS